MKEIEEWIKKLDKKEQIESESETVLITYAEPVQYKYYKRRSKIVPPGGAKTYHPLTI